MDRTVEGRIVGREPIRQETGERDGMEGEYTDEVEGKMK